MDWNIYSLSITSSVVMLSIPWSLGNLIGIHNQNIIRKCSVFCQTFGSYGWDNVHENPFEGCLGLQWYLRPRILLIIEIWHYLQKCLISTLSSIYCQTFAVYPSSSDIVDMYPNLWFDNSREIFFLGVCFYSLTVFFVFTKNACFLCAICVRVSILFFVTEENRANHIV